MPEELDPSYDVSFYAGQLTPPESTEIGILAKILFAEYHREPVEVTRQTDKGPQRIVVRESKVERVLDVGCGMGAFLVAFGNLGVPRVTGVEHPHLYHTVGTSSLPKGVEYEFMDLERPLNGVYLTAWDNYDLILCLEVLEHLAPIPADQLAMNLSRLPGRLVISAAHEGQGGTYHINERPQDYWIGKFSDFGRKLNLTETLAVRDRFTGACLLDHGSVMCSWYAENLLIFDPVPR